MPQRPTELGELGFQGPFGGIQSECGLVQMEGDGFADALNIVFYDSVAMPRPGLAQVTPPIAAPVVAIFDFYDSVGKRHPGVIAGGSIWESTGPGQWSQKTGSLTNTTNLVSWTVIGGQLLFSQGVDPVQMWNGNTATFAAVSSSAVPAFHLGELNFALIACPTVESGSFAPQRLRWTAPGDPTQWTNFASGISDLFNDLGPIMGYRKIYTMGYVFQKWGITAMQPTGNGTVPWILSPLSSKQKGLFFEWTLSGCGEFAVYVGQNNVYLFNGSSSEPIGDMPLRGRSWIGARDRILTDLYATGVAARQAYGFYLPITKSHEYETYWILIPGQSTWVYNFKEQNWTRFRWSNVTANTSVMYAIEDMRAIEIIQLVIPITTDGTIAGLLGTIQDLSGTSTIGDTAVVGFSNGNVGYFDWDEVPDANWSLTTGTLAFGDTRHSKDIRRIRIALEPLTAVNISITATNEQGQTETIAASIPAAPGTTQYQVFPFHIPGFYTQFVLTGPPAQSFKLSEIAIGSGIGKEAATQ